jgi:hypothetical protein
LWREEFLRITETGDEPTARELHDHDTDPGETVNLAEQPDYRSLVTDLGRQLRSGWRAALPID